MNIPDIDLASFYENVDPTPEAVNQYNNLQNIAWLSEALRVARAVGRVVRPGALGTGWLIGEDMIITNHHVVPEDPNPDTHWIEFNYETNWLEKPAQVDRYNLTKVLKSDPELDYAIVQVSGRPGAIYGFIDIKDAKRPALDSAASRYPVIIQHPSGGFKKIALTDNHLKAVDQMHCWYTTDTESGSSGSCVSDQLWRPFALHHASGPKRMPDGSRLILNEGILLVSIVEHAASVLGQKVEHLRLLMKDLLSAGHFAAAPPNFEWYMDNHAVHNAIKLDARGNAEQAPLIAAAAGAAARTAALWKPLNGHNSLQIEAGSKIEIPKESTKGDVFDLVYDRLLNAHKPRLAELAQHNRNYEFAPQASAFLAGLSAGAIGQH